MISLNVPSVPRLTFDLYPGDETEVQSMGQRWTKHLPLPGVTITLFCTEPPSPPVEPLFDSDDVSAMERVAKIAERIRQS